MRELLVERQERIKQLLDWAIEQAVELRCEYIEQMAAAYLLKTNIDPREIELVEDHRGMEIVFYFRHKTEQAQVETEGNDSE